MKDLCYKLTRTAPDKFKFEYVNNYIIDRSSDLCTSSSCGFEEGVSSEHSNVSESSGELIQENPDIQENPEILENPEIQVPIAKSTHSSDTKPKKKLGKKHQESTPKLCKATLSESGVFFTPLSDHPNLTLEFDDSDYRTLIDTPGTNSEHSKNDDCG